MWPSCEGSESAIAAAKIQAKILSGRYRDDYLISKYKDTTGCCTLGSCDHFPGDVTHYLSRDCPALSSQLNTTLENYLEILTEFPVLMSAVLSALSQSNQDFVTFIVDPFYHPLVIPIRQELGPQSVWPLLRLSRAYIWTMHRERKKINRNVNCHSILIEMLLLLWYLIQMHFAS